MAVCNVCMYLVCIVNVSPGYLLCTVSPVRFCPGDFVRCEQEFLKLHLAALQAFVQDLIRPEDVVDVDALPDIPVHLIPDMLHLTRERERDALTEYTEV